MSTIAATNLKNASSGSNNIVLGTSGQTTVNGDLQFNSGYGSAATAYGCRAWVNFDGTAASPITPRGSANISSVTRTATGTFTISFTTALPDANYAVLGSNNSGIGSAPAVATLGTTSFSGNTFGSSGTLTNFTNVYFAVFR